METTITQETRRRTRGAAQVPSALLKHSPAGRPKKEIKSVRYVEPWTDETDLVALIESLLRSSRTSWFGFGEKCIEFEKAFAKEMGTKHAIFVNSGSSANLLSIAALIASHRLSSGSKVVTTACTFPTALNPALLYGLKPVMIDLELPSWSADIDALREALDSGAKLIMLPHLNGIPHRMDEVSSLANQHSSILIEDACDALGSTFGEKPVGTFGDLGTFSFYVAHQMTTGEGGMVVTDDQNLAETVRSLREWGRAPTAFEGTAKNRQLRYQSITKDLPEDFESRYTYTHIGFNLKPLELQGAWGLVQLGKLESMIEKRRTNFERLFTFLSNYPDYITLPEPSPKAAVSWFWFPIIVRQEAAFKRKDIVAFLEENGIETRPVLAGNIMKQPAYRGIDFEVVGTLTNTEAILHRGFIVGVHPRIGDEEIEYMISTFQRFFESL